MPFRRSLRSAVRPRARGLSAHQHWPEQALRVDRERRDREHQDRNIHAYRYGQPAPPGGGNSLKDFLDGST